MKTLKLDSRKNGFTIIEVVLVLAVAGLIFMAIFLALPALQRARRNTQRKRTAGMIAGVYGNYMANNRGKIIDGRMNRLIQNGYVEEHEVTDPLTGEVYELDTNALGWPIYENFRNIAPGSYGYDAGGYCEGNEPRDISGNANHANVVVVFGLEGGGWVCASNYAN